MREPLGKMPGQANLLQGGGNLRPAVAKSHGADGLGQSPTDAVARMQ